MLTRKINARQIYRFIADMNCLVDVERLIAGDKLNILQTIAKIIEPTTLQIELFLACLVRDASIARWRSIIGTKEKWQTFFSRPSE